MQYWATTLIRTFIQEVSGVYSPLFVNRANCAIQPTSWMTRSSFPAFFLRFNSFVEVLSFSFSVSFKRSSTSATFFKAVSFSSRKPWTNWKLQNYQRLAIKLELGKYYRVLPFLTIGGFVLFFESHNDCWSYLYISFHYSFKCQL